MQLQGQPLDALNGRYRRLSAAPYCLMHLFFYFCIQATTFSYCISYSPHVTAEFTNHANNTSGSVVVGHYTIQIDVTTPELCYVNSEGPAVQTERLGSAPASRGPVEWSPYHPLQSYHA